MYPEAPTTSLYLPDIAGYRMEARGLVSVREPPAAKLADQAPVAAPPVLPLLVAARIGGGAAGRPSPRTRAAAAGARAAAAAGGRASPGRVGHAPVRLRRRGRGPPAWRLVTLTGGSRLGPAPLSG